MPRMDDELKRLIESADAATRRHFDETTERLSTENRRHFELTVQRMESRFDALAETVTHLDEKYERRIEELERWMERGFVETQAMIKFSHAELDRRIHAMEQAQRSLEETQRRLEEIASELEARVERLESPTH
ncbi:MAG TPA: hypothetical protein VMT00_07885 [Thermoanaerobaculia bacterium]|nr:hypothetical protein [Thermoanaerobaculia bacterium]